MTFDPDDISRREFVSRTAKTVAGVALGGAAVAGAQSQGAPSTSRRILGANDRVVVASVGVRGQGNALKRGFATLKNVEIKTLCDIDANLFPSRVNDAKLAGVATFKPGTVQDLRRVLDDKDVDGIVIAVPNHWHALATIWGLQAGKHVYVEKPASHTVWEGRKMVEASRRYDRVVQVGTMNRSRPLVQEAIKFVRDGGIGDVYMARGLCFKARPNIGKYPDGPMQPGEKYRLNVEAKEYEPTYDSAYLAKVDYDMWLGPAPKRPFNRNRFHYNWHWHWDYGNGDTGNQGPHQFDIARWGLGEQVHPVKITATGGLFDARDSSQETPDVHTSLFVYPDGKVLEFATRGISRAWQSYLGRKDEKGPGREIPKEAGGSDPNVLTSIEHPHYQNFVDAVRANDRKLLTCDIEEGHLSAALPHLANIAYQTGRALEFDGQAERFKGDKEADALLTREYRAPYVVPDKA
ncbi:MAG: gfo/Idh/MocA family oxidoreductase [Acidobacteria bacterium]|nr:MAG: gfo/Idh/MocA family oxidoreductase [Acidobacteriota bacterium]